MNFFEDVNCTKMSDTKESQVSDTQMSRNIKIENPTQVKYLFTN